MSKLFLSFCVVLLTVAVFACGNETQHYNEYQLTTVNDLYYTVWRDPAAGICPVDYDRSDYYWFYEISKDGKTWVKYSDIAEGTIATNRATVSGTIYYQLKIANVRERPIPMGTEDFSYNYLQFYLEPSDIDDYKYARFWWVDRYYNFELVNNPDAGKFPAYHNHDDMFLGYDGPQNIARLEVLSAPWNEMQYVAEVKFLSRKKILPFSIRLYQEYAVAILPVVAGPTPNGERSPDGVLIGNFPIATVDDVPIPRVIKNIALDSPISVTIPPFVLTSDYPQQPALPPDVTMQARLEYSLVDIADHKFLTGWITAKVNDNPPENAQGYAFGKSPLTETSLTVGDNIILRTVISDGLHYRTDYYDAYPNQKFDVHSAPLIYHIAAQTGPKFKK